MKLNIVGLVFLLVSFPLIASYEQSDFLSYIKEKQLALNNHAKAVELLNDREEALTITEQQLLYVKEQLAKTDEEIALYESLASSNEDYQKQLEASRFIKVQLLDRQSSIKSQIIKLEDRINLAKSRMEEASKAIDLASKELEAKIDNVVEETVREEIDLYKKPKLVVVKYTEPCSNNENLDDCKERGKASAQRKAIEEGSQAIVSSFSQLVNFELEKDLVVSQSKARLISPRFETEMQVSGGSQLSWHITLRTEVTAIPSEDINKSLLRNISTQVNQLVFNLSETVKNELRTESEDIQSETEIAIKDTESLRNIQQLNNATAQLDFIEKQINQIRQNLNISNVDKVAEEVAILKSKNKDIIDFTSIEEEINTYGKQKSLFYEYISKANSAINNHNYYYENGAHEYLNLAKKLYSDSSEITRLEQNLRFNFATFLDTLESEQQLTEINLALEKLGNDESLISQRNKISDILKLNKKKDSFKLLVRRYADQSAFFEPDKFNASAYLSNLEKMGINKEEYSELKNYLLNKIKIFVSVENESGLEKQIRVIQHSLEKYPEEANDLMQILVAKTKKLNELNKPEEKEVVKKKRLTVGGF